MSKKAGERRKKRSGGEGVDNVGAPAVQIQKKAKNEQADDLDLDEFVPLWDALKKVRLDIKKCPCKSRLDAYLSKNPEYEVYTNQVDHAVMNSENARAAATTATAATAATATTLANQQQQQQLVSRPEKRKTTTDIGYDIMASEISASLGNSKAKIYDYWIDISAAEKQKYIKLAKENIQGMSQEELSLVLLTAEEVAELGRLWKEVAELGWKSLISKILFLDATSNQHLLQHKALPPHPTPAPFRTNAQAL